MVIKNPERLGKNVNDEKDIAYIQPKNQENENSGFLNFKKPSSDNKVLQYAQVIELEDPDKERID